MSTIRGCRGKVKSGATPDAVGELTNWRYSESAAQIDVSEMGACVKKFDVGAVQTTGVIEFWWDPADTGQGNFVVGSAIDLELYPDGDATGKSYKEGNGTIQQIDVDGGGVDGVVRASASFFVNGALTDSTVP